MMIIELFIGKGKIKMEKSINAINPTVYSKKILAKKVDDFVKTPKMLNATMRQIIKTKSIKVSEDILDYCIRKGWNDAIIYERFNKSSAIIPNKEKIITLLKKEIQSSEFANNYNSWHNSLCSIKDCGMRYGVWQKLINMTMKYLYCFKGVDGAINFQIPWEDLHCPIDSVIAKKIYGLMLNYNIPDKSNLIESISFSGQYRASWNKIDSEQYKCIQNIISDLCNRGSIPSKMDFDFIYWERQNS